jgi:hypothetical protein
MNIHEVMEYGPIVAHDEEFGLLITVNGAYFNLWVEADASGKGWTNTEAYDLASRVEHENSMSVLYETSFVKAWDAAKTLLEEILAGDEEE